MRKILYKEVRCNAKKIVGESNDKAYEVMYDCLLMKVIDNGI